MTDKIKLRVRQEGAQPLELEVDLGGMTREAALKRISETILPDVREQGGTVTLSSSDGGEWIDVRPDWPEAWHIRKALRELLSEVEADARVMAAAKLTAQDKERMSDALRKGHLAGVHARRECLEGLAQEDDDFIEGHLLRARRFWAERYAKAEKSRSNGRSPQMDKAEQIARSWIKEQPHKYRGMTTDAANFAVQRMFVEHGDYLDMESLRTRLYRR